MSRYSYLSRAIFQKGVGFNAYLLKGILGGAVFNIYLSKGILQEGQVAAPGDFNAVEMRGTKRKHF